MPTDPATVTDQRLVSPAVALPTGQNPVVLKFWHVPNLEPSGTTACYDGGILEVSTDGGTTWTQVPNANLLVGPYTGAVSSSFSNPLAGLQAWCGTTSLHQHHRRRQRLRRPDRAVPHAPGLRQLGQQSGLGRRRRDGSELPDADRGHAKQCRGEPGAGACAGGLAVGYATRRGRPGVSVPCIGCDDDRFRMTDLRGLRDLGDRLK